MPDVHEVLRRMGDFAEQVRDGTWTGATGERIRTIVNIGIGGSDLGPAMAYQALAAFRHAEIDGPLRVQRRRRRHRRRARRASTRPTTLFVVSSKTFTTVETLTNAHTARDWLVAALGDDAVPQHFVAVSTNAEEVAAFGIDTANMFGFWEWVGGRYSVDSAIGLSLMMSIGRRAASPSSSPGSTSSTSTSAAHPGDQRARRARPDRHLERQRARASATKAVLPYAEELARFPAYLQQLDMESNGKSVRLDGTPVTLDTGPIVWGEPGPTVSTRSTNCSTRAPGSCPPTSSASPTRTTRTATTTTCWWPT